MVYVRVEFVNINKNIKGVGNLLVKQEADIRK